MGQIVVKMGRRPIQGYWKEMEKGKVPKNQETTLD